MPAACRARNAARRSWSSPRKGAKQTDIADLLDVSQSTVSDTLRKDRMRRMSEGLEPAKIDNTDFDSADDDQPLDLDMGNRETDIRSYIDSFVSQSSDARGAINEMVHLLESDKWQPGGSTVSEIGLPWRREHLRHHQRHV